MIAVDTHIFRVANRTGLAPGEDVVEVERKLDKFTPDEFKLQRAPLADPARPLRLRRAHAEVPAVRHPRPVRVPAQDAEPAPAKAREGRPAPPLASPARAAPADGKTARAGASAAGR